MRSSVIGKVIGVSVLLRFLVTGLAVALPGDSARVTEDPKRPKFNHSYTFLKLSQNKITTPDSKALTGFYQALDSLKNGTRKKVNVVHIGDSHIQADLFSGRVRTLMQDSAVFGNGGRGFVFPYPLARTNNPYNYKVTSTGQWTGCRNVQRNQNCEWGLAGITAETIDSSATFSLQTLTSFNKYPVSHLRVFYPVKDESQFEVLVEAADSVYRPIKIDPLGFAEFAFAYEVTQLTVKFQKTNPKQYHFTLQGISLENNRPGVQYASLGVNGAEVISFLRNPALEENLKALNPDLIIISLGTNDSYGRNFDPVYFKQIYGTLLQRIRRAAPNTSILLTTPGDCYLNRKYPNYSTGKAVLKIHELAEETGCAVWDFYRVMGGLRSVVKWQYSGLATKDRVHLTGKGYKLQGELLFDALMRDYLSND
ncbi:GDSL-type esterase/lipase family protein [Adhaeribacter soli]|nr:GDSL-type esterase/lipase family protein [Adhaeribacter soli]